MGNYKLFDEPNTQVSSYIWSTYLQPFDKQVSQQW